ncbi:hypothetical protein BU24DRAFT_470259 [Aaosphaeria arxii CBS 175.79]|uniref:BTB domain-containing protein n=1 Tax=Aaosphaeria arxii CBS 175.79 TaxID=1450172 RepID=A0A6A5Y9Q4_9PLEO|nr:uncharacterized protein BU24DRAFT_470259 [Aaosphaeria arxii CBS 175.79]KAF2021491.1 hypothetical protein BU24DRAFT_470259 [Aaosphaeria arxii CBS 175.79]
MATNDVSKNTKVPGHEFSKIVASPMATITVKCGKQYYIHEILLVNVSKYFSNALEGNFKEASEKKVHLETVESDTFERFSSWLYTGTFKTTEVKEKSEVKNDNHSDNSKNCNDCRSEQCNNLYRELLDLYIFADGHAINGLPNAIVDQFGTLFITPGTVFPSDDLIRTAYSNLPHTSGLIRLLVDDRCRWSCKEGEEDDAESSAELPLAYLLQVYLRQPVILDRVKKSENPKRTLRLDIEDYHDHSENDRH